MIVTVGTMIQDAMGLINATEMDETPSASEMAKALRAANAMLGRWATQRLLLRATTAVAFNTVVGQETYTIGLSGATITAAKPLSILSGDVKDSMMHYPLVAIPKDQLGAFGDREVSQAMPTHVSYDPGAAQQAVHTGTITLYPVPNKVYAVTLDADAYLTELVNLTDNITFEPVYYEALLYGLAVRLFRRYSDDKTPVPVDLAKIAHDSLNNLRTLNGVRMQMTTDLPGSGGGVYNALTDSYQ
jgi:hypothetical protein